MKLSPYNLTIDTLPSHQCDFCARAAQYEVYNCEMPSKPKMMICFGCLSILKLTIEKL
jgi:hypothetical protein